MRTRDEGTATLHYQYAGENEGEYHINLTQRSPLGISFIVLLAKFDMCSDTSNIDDSREDLYDVVVAKHNGLEF